MTPYTALCFYAAHVKMFSLLLLTLLNTGNYSRRRQSRTRGGVEGGVTGVFVYLFVCVYPHHISKTAGDGMTNWT